MVLDLIVNNIYDDTLRSRAAMRMRSKKIRYLISFLVAMFVANNVAAAAYACITAINGRDAAAIRILESVKHAEQGPANGDSCRTHCAQGEVIQQQELAPAVNANVFAPAPLFAPLAIKFKPAAAILSLAPQVIGPPLPILFHNLRN